MFKNEPGLDFSIENNRDQFTAALEALELRIQQKELIAFPLIRGQKVDTGEFIEREDPAEFSVILGRTHLASEKEVNAALDLLTTGQKGWALTPAAERCQIIKKAASLMQSRRLELAAMLIREAGKPWAEADADVCEAIDFCEYYAEQMLELSTPKKTQEVMGETNYYFYKPKGVAAVISPWNFPLAIACGMTVAALVAGNATILKPSEQTGLIAYEFAKILLQAGVPSDAFAFLPGYGEIVGKQLVDDVRTDLICFTGSKAVGLEIIYRGGQVKEGQKGIKKVIAEMGGKNAIIIDEDADLDEAVKGVIYSAFGFAGQKCSACSRAIIVGSAYEVFLSRLCDAASDIIIGRPKEPSSFTGPVIDRESRDRIMKAIERAQTDNLIAFKGEAPVDGYFVPPTILKDVPSDSFFWTNEIFGPFLACAQASDFDEALKMANNSEYALTGGVYSRSPANIQKAYEEFLVGNLYINRGCTGAIVQRQPFGGFNMSGIGSKAGGPDYLLQFMDPRTVTENSMRRGLTPELS